MFRYKRPFQRLKYTIIFNNCRPQFRSFSTREGRSQTHFWHILCMHRQVLKRGKRWVKHLIIQGEIAQKMPAQIEKTERLSECDHSSLKHGSVEGEKKGSGADLSNSCPVNTLTVVIEWGITKHRLTWGARGSAAEPHMNAWKLPHDSRHLPRRRLVLSHI